MTELNDHLKLLFARAAHLHCRRCGRDVKRDTPESICDDLLTRAAAAGDPRVLICFPVQIPKNFKEAEVLKLLEAQGYTRIHERSKTKLEVVQDRLRLGGAERSRVAESIEAALRVGQGRLSVHVLDDGEREAAKTRELWRYSSSCTAPSATSTIVKRTRVRSRSTRRWVPAMPAAALVASLAWTTGSSFR